MRKLVAITGASGFIATEFQNYYANKYDFIRISRHSDHDKNIYTWDDIRSEPQLLSNVSCVINLAGANIGAKRWTTSRKQELLASRIKTTSDLVKILNSLPTPPDLLCAGAIGIYPTHGMHDEDSLIDYAHYATFSEEITKQWEMTTRDYHGRVVNMRFGVVLSSRGGALSKILLPFKLGLGSGIGSGEWPFCWISSTDLLRAIDYLIQQRDFSGVINLVAPQQAKYKDLIAAIVKTYHRKCWFNLPPWLIHLMFGQMGDELLLTGQTVIPKRLSQLQFEFEYPTIEKCIQSVYANLI